MKATNKKDNLFKSDTDSLINLVKHREASNPNNIQGSWDEIEKTISLKKKRHYISYSIAAVAIILLLLAINFQP